MDPTLLTLSYLLMIWLQMLHIFEEIGSKAYVLAGSLRKYLFAASGLVTLSFAALALIILEFGLGYALGILAAVIATGNGFVHVAGYLKTKTTRESLGAGVFTGIPLGIAGIWVLYLLLRSTLF